MASTVFATVTTPGPQGQPGPPGYSPQYIVQAGPPTAGLGQNGDMFIDSATGNVWGPKTGGSWGGAPSCNIKGPTGATGATGYTPQYIVAAGAPTAGVGQNSDMFIDSGTSNVWGPKTGGSWGGAPVCNIKGATGSVGAQGPPGVGYSAKGAWAAGTTYAQGDQVSDVNLLYISLQSTNVGHTPASSPTWWVSVGSAASQTPWLSTIDAATNILINAGKIAVGNSGATVPDASPSSVHVIVGPITASANYGEITACGNATNVTAPMGILNFANYNISVTEKRVAAIVGYCDGAINSGNLTFYTWNSGAAVQGMIINHAGKVIVGPISAPSSLGHALTVAASGVYGICATGAGTDTGIMVQNTSTGGRQYSIYSSGASSSLGVGNFTIYDDTASTFRITLTSAGNVGIGQMNPAYKLDVNGTLGFATYLYGDGKVALQTSPSDAYLRINGLGSYTSGIWLGPSPLSMNSGPLHIGSLGGVGDVNISATNATAASRIQIDGNANAVTYFATKGAFGIGTASPTGMLTVIPAANPTSIATATQIQIGEGSDNVAYRFSVGYAPISGVWCGVIQSIQANAASYLLLNANGGLVGIGTSTTLPVFNLQVAGNIGATQAANLHITLGAFPAGVASSGITCGGLYYDTTNNCLRLETLTGAVAWRPLVINYSGGNVGIGANAAPGFTLDVTGNCRATNGFTTTSKGNTFGGAVGSSSAPTPADANIIVYANSSVNWAGIGANSNGDMWFRAGLSGTPMPTLTLLANPTNRVGINQLNPSYALDVTGDINCQSGNFRINGAIFAGGGVGVQVQSGTPLGGLGYNFAYLNFWANSSLLITGTLSGPSNNTALLQWSYTSDIKLKRNVQPLTGGLPQILQLRPISAEWNGLAGSHEGQRVVSIIAQELREVIPDAVAPFRAKLRQEDEEDTELLSYDSMAITSHLILAIQQLEARLAAVEAKVN